MVVADLYRRARRRADSSIESKAYAAARHLLEPVSHLTRRDAGVDLGKNSMMLSLLAALGALVASSAYAGVNTVPEPGTFELLALAGVLAAVIAIRKRRK
jgi:hypothetical protein